MAERTAVEIVKDAVSSAQGLLRSFLLRKPADRLAAPQELTNEQIAEQLSVDANGVERKELVKALTAVRQLQEEGRSSGISVSGDGQIHLEAAPGQKQQMTHAGLGEVLGIDPTGIAREELDQAVDGLRKAQAEGRSVGVMPTSDGQALIEASALAPQQLTNEQIAAELEIDGAGIERGQLINALITAREVEAELIPDAAGSMHHHVADVSVQSGRITVERGTTIEDHLEQRRGQAGEADAGAQRKWTAQVDGARTGRVLE